MPRKTVSWTGRGVSSLNTAFEEFVTNLDAQKPRSCQHLVSKALPVSSTLFCIVLAGEDRRAVPVTYCLTDGETHMANDVSYL